jgi:hypothetical protein
MAVAEQTEKLPTPPKDGGDTALFRCDQPDDGSVIYRPQPLPSAQGCLEPGTVPGHRLNRGTPSGSHSATLVGFAEPQPTPALPLSAVRLDTASPAA